MLVCTTGLYKYIHSLRNYVNNVCGNTHVRIKIYREFYHGITHVRIIEYAIILF